MKHQIDKKIALFVIVFVFVFMIPFISGLGITPGRTTIDFEPGLEKNVSFSVINSEKENMSLVFHVQGDLNESITLNKKYAELSPSEESKTFSYNVELPEKIEESGTHKTKIIALKMPEDIKKQGKFVGSTLSVATQLYVDVPYPKKYLEVSSEVINTNKGENAMFLVPIANKGKQGIKEAKAIIDIYNPVNEKIASIETKGKGLESGQRKELIGEWEANVNPGKYRADITVIYDGETVNTEKIFKIGKQVLEIQKIEVNDFELGGIAKFNALIENKYNQKIKDTYLKLEVYNNEEETIAEIKSANYNLEALEKKNMVTYWDTAGVEKGTYNAKLSIKHSKGSFERDLKLKVSSNEITVQGISGEVLIEKMEESNIKKILIYAVAILIILNLLWFLVVRRLFLKKNLKKLSLPKVQK